MKKHGGTILVVITFAFCAFTLGYYIGRKSAGPAISVSVPASMQTLPPQATIPISTAPQSSISFPININTATKEELMALPGIGEELAQRILDYRSAVVLFSSPEELIHVEGIGQSRLEQILHMITIGGST